MGEEHDSDAGPTVSRGNPTGKPKRNQLEIELVGVRGGGPRSKQVSVSVTRAAKISPLCVTLVVCAECWLWTSVFFGAPNAKTKRHTPSTLCGVKVRGRRLNSHATSRERYYWDGHW